MGHRLIRSSILLAVAFAASACSSGSGEGEVTSAAGGQDVTETAADPQGDEPAGDFAISCEEAGEAAMIVRASALTMGQLNTENEDLIELDYDALLAAIEVLRPIQDVDGIFGPMRDNLDNLEADVAVLREQRYDDTVGDYGVATMNAVIGEEICS